MMLSSPLVDVRRHASTPDLIAEGLREAINRGELSPGVELRQTNLARHFKVSRIPLREAFRRLESEGLIVFYPNRGARVAELSASDVTEIYGLRVLLESDAIARAIPNLNAANISRVEELHAALGRVADTRRLRLLNREFHAALYAPAGQSRQIHLIERLAGTVERFEIIRQSFLEGLAELQREHGRILECCRACDVAGAREAVENHLRHAAELARDAIENQRRIDGES